MPGNLNNGASAIAAERNSVNGNAHSAVVPRTAQVIQGWLVARLSELLGIEPREIDVREPFASYGLGSTEMVMLSGELADWLGRSLSAELAYEYPTIETLARHLAGTSDISSLGAVVDPERGASNEPIAIIGIGCRFPGASGPDAFWNLLRDSIDAISEVPASRFDLRTFYDPDAAAPGKMTTRWGGFLEQVDQFDPHFFGISPREAARMDPQQRLLLEVAWEALQDAGQVAEAIAGTQAGVFIGISNNDYGRIQFGDLRRIDAYAGTGNALSIAANRISYLLDLRGPSIAVDTACSSSLVAVHLACRSLWSGESNLALAGGVNLILSPAITINFSKAGVMAPDGRCKTFDARADGYVRSEGAGVVVLKPLSKALADADPIYAVIRGSAMNQDGRSNGLMAPNPLAQEAVLREAYRRAGVAPADVQYTEAHGTGTLLGDPIEVKALGAVVGDGRPADQPCAIGAVKTNIGHLEAAAGIAGLIKVALALRHREIPPNLHFEEPNPHIPFDQLPLRVQTALTPWPAHAGPALAGVSSFGFGGTNAHVVLEAAPHPTLAIQNHEEGARKSAHLLPLSARSPEALKSLARAHQAMMTSAESSLSLADICYTASLRRSHHDYRLAVAGGSREQLAEGLQAFLDGEARPGMSFGRRDSGRRRKLAFVFSGQGSQWLGMGRSLLRDEPVFREVIERCDRAMRSYTDWSLLAELTADANQSRMNQVDIVQPALFAIQVGVATLWRSWGIEPDAVVGHSMGEVAAACVAGALSLEDAASVICNRSRLVKRAAGQGAMAAVELSLEDARDALAGYEARVSIAASNSPTSTVLSGDPAALEEILEQLRRREVFCATVKVDFASHSPQMDPLRAELMRALEGIKPRATSVPIYSTVTGKIADGLAFDASYWSRNLREPVLFSAAIQHLLEDGHDIFVEISPHPILLSSIEQCVNQFGHEGAVLSSMRRDADERSAMLASLGALYALGHPIDWKRIYPIAQRCVSLPMHPWNRERCWMEAAAEDSDPRWESRGAKGTHSLLGRHFKSAQPGGTHFWEVTLDQRVMPYLEEHRVEGVAVLPASAYIEMALAAAAETFVAQEVALEDVEFHRAMFIPDGDARALQLILSPAPDGAASFQIYSHAAGVVHSGKSWTLHASGRIVPQSQGDSVFSVCDETISQIQARCTEVVSGTDYYARLSESGIYYGPFFQRITQLFRHDGDVLAEMRVSDAAETELDACVIHPACLDACLQAAGAAVAAEASGIFMPTHIDEVRVRGGAGPRLWSYAHINERDADRVIGEARLLDGDGRAVVEMSGLRFESLEGNSRRAIEENVDEWLYEFRWQPKDRDQDTAQARPAADGETWIIFADRDGVGEALAAQIEAHGARSVVVSAGDSYQAIDGDHFTIRPQNADDLRQLYATAVERNQSVCRGIVYLWSIDSPAPDETTLASLTVAQSLGCGTVLPLVQELARAELSDPPCLWIVTRGAQAAGDELLPVDMAQAPLWGMGRVIAQEHAAMWGGLLDLEPVAIALDETSARLWQQISASDGEDQIAFRHGRRFVGRLVRRPDSTLPQRPLALRADGAYLITGGLGDLGLVVARWMVERGARRLILLGRTQLPPRASWGAVDAGSRLAHQIDKIRELEALGASVHLAAVDVADEAQLSAFLDEFNAEGWPQIRGVVHAAGVIQDGLLSQLDQAAFDAVMRPKVMGGWLLHRLLEHAPLDFFVMFSSAGALLGQPGQGNYAAANAFLDALTHQRRAQHQPALSINWGAWAELGFADSAGGKRLAARLALVGIRSMAERDALEVLERMIGQDATQVAAVPVDWRQYRQFYSAVGESPLLSELAREEVGVHQPTAHAGEKRDAILVAEPAARRQILQSYLTEQVARVLGASASKLDLEQPLSNLGLDSLMAVELKNRISVDVGVNVPMVKFLQGPTIAQATTLILEQLMAELSAAPQVAQHEEDLPNVDQLSDDEVNSLLTDMLDEAELSE
jgi:acyl transferase domain-containing protein/acyl carrier protein